MNNKKILAGALFTVSAVFAFKAVKDIKDLKKDEDSMDEVIDDADVQHEEKN